MNDKPNILLIMTDQQRWDSLGCYGVDFACTPNLDKLASQGTIFENCYASNTVCTPSRASMMTGKNIYGHGVYRLYDTLPDDEILFPKHLQGIGYQTALFGKLHVSTHTVERDYRHPNDGFDVYEMCHEPGYNMESKYQSYARWLKEKSPEYYQQLQKNVRLPNVPEEYHMTHWAAERTIDYLDNYNGEKPFFCMMSVFDPHDPYDDCPPVFTDLVKPEKIPPPQARISNNEPADIDRDRRGGCTPWYEHSMAEIREMRHGYHSSIAFLDHETGKVLEALERNNLTENTLVIFTSDHGDMLGDHNLIAKGAFFYDPCTKVPLIIRWPARIAQHQREHKLVQNIDLAATVLVAAGVNNEEIKELMPEAYDFFDNDAPRKSAFCAYRNTGTCRYSETRYFAPEINATMVRNERFKYNLYYNASSGAPAGEELYDMENDPLEFDNLALKPEYAGIKEQLEKQIEEFIAVEKSSRGRNI